MTLKPNYSYQVGAPESINVVFKVGEILTKRLNNH